MKFDKLLQFARSHKASDLILKADAAPILRIHGELRPVDSRPLENNDLREFLISTIGEKHYSQFRNELELDVSVSMGEMGRFRINAYYQRRKICTVLRLIADNVPSLNDLHLPPVAREFAMRDRGLVLVTGPAGSGKTTSIAAMIQYRAARDSCHIITVEDPVEYIIPSQKALVDQRELGRDTRSFSNALRHSLRQDPDVIVVGEMRDLDTIQMAITAAETGHLVLSTLHTVDALRTVDRIIDVFPQYQQRQVRLQLSANLVGVISQTLLQNVRGDGRILAAETLVATHAIKNLIRESKTFMIGSIMRTSGQESMKTMNRYMSELIKKKLVTYEECLSKSPDPAELEKMFGRRASILSSAIQT